VLSVSSVVKKNEAHYFFVVDVSGRLAAWALFKMGVARSHWDMDTVILSVIGGLVAGALGSSLVWQKRLRDGQQAVWQERELVRAAEERQRSAEERARGVQQQLARVETELTQQQQSHQKLVELMHKQLPQTFESAASEALRRTQNTFLELAQEKLKAVQGDMKGDLDGRQRAVSELVTPVSESLQKLNQRISELEQARVGAHEALKTQIESLSQANQELRREAHGLAHALRQPQVRGRWGEMQLRRAVELGGMAEHCDFTVQNTSEIDGLRQRPDMVIHLPGGRHIVVDAKAPLSAYLEAIDCPDEAIRNEKMALHARQVRDHIVSLSRKSYWEQYQPSPELVVLFLPGESFLSAAVERDPLLLEGAVDQRVIVATPTTLIALLRAIAYGWRQENLSAKAQSVVQIGRQLSKRLTDMLGHLGKMGRTLQGSVEAYNQALGSLERRVVPSLRQLYSCEGILDEVETPESIEVWPRDDLSAVADRLALTSDESQLVAEGAAATSTGSAEST
jgi:DNA recombination protein RmuC